MSLSEQELTETLRCPGCLGQLRVRKETGDGIEVALVCSICAEEFPVIDSIPRLLLSPFREALLGNGIARGVDARQLETAMSFGFEWSRFPEMYEEWKKYGAEVWAIDLGPAVEVARKNTEQAGRVQVVQSDLHRPPFALESFDFIYSIGVLHHLPDPEEAFQNLLRYLKPGGEVQIYLYWKPERQPIKRALLSLVDLGRKITTRLPHRAVYALAFPAAVAAFGVFVWPYRIAKNVPGLKSFAEKIPMKQYARFPFRVCVNDQLDRFSAPIENRYTKQQVADWLSRAKLESTRVGAAYGWVGTGRKPRP